jgi:hypothetical protein
MENLAAIQIWILWTGPLYKSLKLKYMYRLLPAILFMWSVIFHPKRRASIRSDLEQGERTFVWS